MMPLPVLNSKLLIPKADISIIRKRLFPFQKTILHKKLTTVIAAAGYGKTTMVSQAIQSLGKNAVWYQLDDNDNNLHVFLSYLVRGFSNHCADIELKITPFLSQHPTSQREVAALLSAFLIEVENSFEEDVVVVLDDYHLIIDNIEVNFAIQYLLDRIPPNIHFVVITRNDPEQFSLINLSILRSRQQLLEISETDIAFTFEETRQAVLELFNDKIPDKDLKKIYKQTGGWITGVILGCPRNSEAFDLSISNSKGSTDNIYKYFESNVLAHLPDEIVNFLLQSSNFSELQTDLCNHLLEINNSYEIMTFLTNQRIFISPFYEKDGYFRYHHLFKKFLQARYTNSASTGDLRRFNLKIASRLESINKKEEAIAHFLKAQSYDNVARVLKEIGAQLLIQGNLIKTKYFMEHLPKEKIENDPDLIFLDSKIKWQRGDIKGAIDGYYQALELFKGVKDVEGELNCLEILGFHYTVVGDLPTANAIFEHLLPRLQSAPHLKIVVLGRLSFVSSFFGDFNAADEYVNQGYQALAQVSSQNKAFAHANLYMAQSLRHQWSGDFNKSISIGHDLVELCKDENISEILSFAYNLLSKTYYNSGDFQTGHEMGRLGVIESERAGLKDIFHAWPLQGVAFNLVGLNDISEAIVIGEKALRLFQSHSHSFGEARALQLLHLAHLRLGDKDGALRYLKNGIEAIKKGTLPLAEGELQCDLAALMVMDGKFSEAIMLLNQAKEKLRQAKYETARVLRLFAVIEWTKKNKAKSRKYLEQSLELCIENDYTAWFEKEYDWIAPMILDALKDSFIKLKHRTFLKDIVNSSTISSHKLAAQSTRQTCTNSNLPFPLSNREIEVLVMMTKGLTNTEISDTLHISPNTVKSHVVHIFNKLGVNDRVQAAVWAVQNNLL